MSWIHFVFNRQRAPMFIMGLLGLLMSALHFFGYNEWMFWVILLLIFGVGLLSLIGLFIVVASDFRTKKTQRMERGIVLVVLGIGVFFCLYAAIPALLGFFFYLYQ